MSHALKLHCSQFEERLRIVTHACDDVGCTQVLTAGLAPTAGGLVVTAGGTCLCVWDMLAGGRLLQRLSQHQKTVTCVALSPLAGPDSAAAPRMLSGSLDGHVKVCMRAIPIAFAAVSW